MAASFPKDQSLRTIQYRKICITLEAHRQSYNICKREDTECIYNIYLKLLYFNSLFEYIRSLFLITNCYSIHVAWHCSCSIYNIRYSDGYRAVMYVQSASEECIHTFETEKNAPRRGNENGQSWQEVARQRYRPTYGKQRTDFHTEKNEKQK